MLTPVQKLALNSLKLTDKERATVQPGNHDVDFTITVKGKVIVAKDETYTPTSDVPLIPTVALALKRMGIQREGFLEVLNTAMIEVLTANAEMRKALVAELGLDEFEKQFRANMAKLPRKTRAGKTSTEVKVIER